VDRLEGVTVEQLRQVRAQRERREGTSPALHPGSVVLLFCSRTTDSTVLLLSVLPCSWAERGAAFGGLWLCFSSADV